MDGNGHIHRSHRVRTGVQGRFLLALFANHACTRRQMALLLPVLRHGGLVGVARGRIAFGCSKSGLELPHTPSHLSVSLRCTRGDPVRRRLLGLRHETSFLLNDSIPRYQPNQHSLGSKACFTALPFSDWGLTHESSPGENSKIV